MKLRKQIEKIRQDADKSFAFGPPQDQGPLVILCIASAVAAVVSLPVLSLLVAILLRDVLVYSQGVLPLSHQSAKGEDNQIRAVEGYHPHSEVGQQYIVPIFTKRDDKLTANRGL